MSLAPRPKQRPRSKMETLNGFITSPFMYRTIRDLVHTGSPRSMPPHSGRPPGATVAILRAAPRTRRGRCGRPQGRPPTAVLLLSGVETDRRSWSVNLFACELNLFMEKGLL
ncbi:unnamed protein product [Gadus morhua 'NCC']